MAFESIFLKAFVGEKIIIFICSQLFSAIRNIFTIMYFHNIYYCMFYCTT